jgi:fatty acid desaturase
MKGERSTLESKIQYVPSKNDFKSVTIACGILFLFFLFWYHALFQINLTKTNWFDIIGTFFCLEFLYTGLFINCHDAMHGMISSRVSSRITYSKKRSSLVYDKTNV